jgi:hypothetical protein
MNEYGAGKYKGFEMKNPAPGKWRFSRRGEHPHRPPLAIALGAAVCSAATMTTAAAAE